ncbi:MAG: HTH-type transcriptional repressor NsrR [Pelotomaculum sp. PtaB.Bin104]|nr:MAG: HTH-type transcriptional repressor NsrR [Pelotomaculum sp. PtaB.Bin104]
MHFTRRSEYAVHSLFYLALRSADEPVLLQELAADQHLSPSYLAKVMQRLAGAGLVRAYVGGNGGYTLARSAREITFADAVRAVEGQAGLFNCLQQQRRCIAGPGCEIQKVFQEAEQEMMHRLEQTTIQDLVDLLFRRKLRLKWLGQ